MKNIFIVTLLLGFTLAGYAQTSTEAPKLDAQQKKKVLKLQDQISKTETRLTSEKDQSAALETDVVKYSHQAEKAAEASSKKEVTSGDTKSAKNATRAAKKSLKLNKKLKSTKKKLAKSQKRIKNYTKKLAKYHKKMEAFGVVPEA